MSTLAARTTERQQRWRARARRGEIVVATPISAAVIDMLVGLRWLAEDDVADRARIGEALGRMALDLAEHR
jgi:hypothetical protein